MDDKTALPADFGAFLRQRRKAARMSVSEVAERAGKSRDVIYRLEKGEDVSSHSLFAVIRALGLSVQLVSAGLPTLEEVRARFANDGDDEDDA